jgi:PAS domain S-box-containing protein
MSSEEMTSAALRQMLGERDAEIAALRAQLIATQLAATSPYLGDLPNFVAQMQGLFAGVITVNQQGLLNWANSRFLLRCRCRLAAVLGKPLGNLLAKTSLDGATQVLITQGLAKGVSFQFDLPDPCPNYEGGWLRVHMQPLWQPASAELLFVGLLEDISQERRDQLALAESERRYRDLAENVPGVLYRWRKKPDGTFTSIYVSPKAYSTFGLRQADVPHLSEYVHPEDRTRWEESIAASTAEGSTIPWNFEGRLTVPGQPMRWWRGNGALSYRDAEGDVYSGIMQDITFVKQAEEAARHDQLRRHLAVEGLGDGGWEYDCQRRTLTISAEYKAMLGYADHECPNEYTGWTHYLPSDEAEVVLAAWQAYQQGQTNIFSCEHRLLMRDGRTKWVLNRALVTKRDAAGEPLLITGINTDITTSKQVEAALSVSALRLSTTIASLHRGILLLDENQRIVLTNNSFCRVFGLQTSPEEMIGLSHLQVVEMIKHNFEKEGGIIPYIEEKIRRQQPRFNGLVTLRNGRVIQHAFVPVRDGETDIGHLWKFEDITERHNAEQVLKRQEEKYRNIIENMQLGLVEMDLDHRVLYANQSYCQMVGYAAHELLGQYLHPLIIRPEHMPALRERVIERDRGITGSYELEVRTKQGEAKWLFIGAAPLFDEAKQPVGTIGINLDITHQKALEQSLREAKQQAEDSARAKELFLANMSHEIRTPMNAIMGMSQLLAKTPLASKQSNYLHAITTSAQNLLVIINDILDLSKLDAGKMMIEQVGFNVSRLCAQVEKTLLYKAEEKGLRFETRIDPLIPDVLLGDPYRITQVLLNLASNSIKFTPKGSVTIECEVAGYVNGRVIVAFTVADTGVGIDPSYLDDIFQEFSQEDSSITRKFGGTGLGLSICRSLAQLMGGEIHIESEKNKGTVSHFSLFLPVGTVNDLPQRKSMATELGRHPDFQGKQVLLVEDNEYNRLLAKTFLANAGLNVTEAENGAEAVEKVKSQTFDLILMDVQMPVMDGFEATKLLREQLRLTTPIIALTASAINGEKQKCLAAGMNDYLTKPFYEEELLMLVHDWVLGAHSTSESGEVSTVSTSMPVPGAPTVALYKLDMLLDTARGNQKFVAMMIQTFINGTYAALRDLSHALEIGNTAALQSIAHKLRPSLVHLQIKPVVALMDSLENWVGPFSYDDLQPLVEASDQLLREVLAGMSAELEAQTIPSGEVSTGA